MINGLESSETFGRKQKFFFEYKNLRTMNILEIANLLELVLANYELITPKVTVCISNKKTAKS